MLFILSLVGVAHLMATGFVARKAEVIHRAKCHSCPTDVNKKIHSYCAGIQVLWFAYGFLWPIVAPIALGLNMGVQNPDRLSREEKNFKKEIAKAEYMSQLAKIRLQEAADLERAVEINTRNNTLNIP